MEIQFNAAEVLAAHQMTRPLHVQVVAEGHLLALHHQVLHPVLQVE